MYKKIHLLSNYPTLSVILATFNSHETIEACLDSLIYQKYPKDKMEVLVADGGSSDETLDIIKTYQGKLPIHLFHIPKEKQEAEYNKGVAVSQAKNEVLVFIDHDNILPHEKWLENMVSPLVQDKEISGVEVLRFSYKKNDKFIDRYFALLGGVDPIPYYLGKDARLSWAFDTYTLNGKAEDKGAYYKVTFEKNSIPTLGANGAMLRRKLLAYAQADPEHFFHIDINFDIIKKGYTAYAFVKDEIIHNKTTRLRDFVHFLWRRKYIIERQYFSQLGKRRYAVYVPETDRNNLLLYILYSLTFIKPLKDAIYGYNKINDKAWFIHPFVCFSFTIVYGIAVLNVFIRSNFTQLHKK